MDWGKGILLTIIGFVGFITLLVVISVRMDGIELVTENYYAEEIKYQEQIDKEHLALDLAEKVMHYDFGSKSIVLELPRGSSGELQLFRPSDSSLDQFFRFDLVDEQPTKIPVRHLKSGYWKFRLNWQVGGRAYYEEKKIDL